MASLDDIKEALKAKHLKTGGKKDKLEQRLAMWKDTDTEKAIKDLRLTDEMLSSIERNHLRSMAGRMGVFTTTETKDGDRNKMEDVVKQWLSLARELRALGVRPEGKIEDLTKLLKFWSKKTPQEAIADKSITAEQAAMLDTTTLTNALMKLGVNTSGEESPRLLVTQLILVLRPSEKSSLSSQELLKPKRRHEKKDKKLIKDEKEEKERDGSTSSSQDQEDQEPQDPGISGNSSLGFCVKKPSQPLVETIRKHYINHRKQGNATYYVYLLLDPRLYDANLCLEGFLKSVFYVGKGHGGRVDSYYKASSNHKDTEYSSPKLRHIRHAWDDDTGYVSIKLFQNSAEDMALDLEYAMIRGMIKLAGKHIWKKGPEGHVCWHDPTTGAKCLTNRILGSPKSGVKNLTPESILNLALEIFQHAYTIATAENAMEECILLPTTTWKKKRALSVTSSVIQQVLA